MQAYGKQTRGRAAREKTCEDEEAVATHDFTSLLISETSNGDLAKR
jgi:hypothetical protein